MMEDVLKKQYQSDAANNATRDCQCGAVPSIREHGDKEEGAKPDYGEGPQEAPIHACEDTTDKRKQAEADQQRTDNQCACVRTICLHFSFSL
jgi:hypothetical protein